jgi:hypothetical protein
VEVLSITVLLAVKFIIYTLYLGSLARRWNVVAPGWKWALVRIALGLVAGGILWFIAQGPGTGGGVGIYVVGLGLGRIVAWALTLGLAFGERVRAPALALATAVGVALSYVVDIPMFLGLLQATGGIC